MAASQEQKVDFLLKKIGYTASKTGIAEDETGISGTKKAPFAEPIPSPLTLPGANVWAQSNQIPTTPPGSTTSIVRVYKTGTAQQLTFDSTVAGNRSFVSRETPGEVTSTVVGDWVDTQFGSDYIVKVYKGDPNSGGVQLSAAGSGSNDTWFFDYSAGVLNFNGTNVPSGITTANIYLEGYRYTGIKGVTGVAQTFTDLEISGITTFNGAVDMNSTLDVDGDTQLDDLNVAGVTTFLKLVDVNNRLDVVGGANLDQLNLTGVSTFASAVDINAGLDVDGQADLDEVVVAGVSTFSSLVDVNNRLDVVGGANLDQLNVAGVSTFAGITTVTGSDLFTQRLNVAGISTFHKRVNALGYIYVGDVGTSGRVLISNGTSFTYTIGNIGGNLTLRSSNGGVKADDNIGRVMFAGQPGGAFSAYHSGSNKLQTTSTGVNVNGNVVSDGLVVDGHSELDNLNVSGVSTFAGIATVTGETLFTKQLNAAGVSTFNGNIIVSGANEIGIGTNNPADPLHIFSSEDGQLRLESADNGAVYQQFYRYNSGTSTRISYFGFGGTGNDMSLANEIPGGDVLIKTTPLGASAGSEENALQIKEDKSVIGYGDLNIAGVATFSSLIDANNRLDVVGGANIDQLNIAGVSTFAGITTVTGETLFTKQLNAAGISTFKDDVEFHGASGIASITFDKSANELNFKDDVKLTFGDAGTTDSQIHFDGANLNIKETSGGGSLRLDGHNIFLRNPTQSDEIYLKCNGQSTDRSVELYHQGEQRLETTKEGIIVSGGTTTGTLSVTGVSTFVGAIDANGTLDVDGHTELDDVNVSGAITATTFTGNLLGTVNTAAQPNITSLGTLTGLTVSGAIDANAGLDVDGQADLDEVVVAGVSTFSALVDIDAGAQANSFKVEDLTNNRLVIAGTGGELEDSSKVTFDGSTLAVLGDATFSGNVTIGGTLIKEDITNIDSIGIVTAGRGVRVTAGGLVVNSGLGTFSDSAYFPDNSKIKFGDATTPDLEIYHSGDHSFIKETGTGQLQVWSSQFRVHSADGGETMIAAFQNGGVKLNFNGPTKIQTTNEGVLVSGGTTTGTLSVTGVSTFTGAIDANGNISVGGTFSATGANISGVVTATSFSGNLATTDLTGTITNAQLAGSIANDKLSNSTVSYGGISLALGSSDATPAFNLSDATNYPTSSLSGTITNSQLAGSIANDKLANSSVSYGGVSLSLGGTDATPAFDLSDATNYPTSSLSGTITNAQLAGSIADSKLSTISTAGKVDLAALEIDGGTDIGAALADADLFIVDDAAGGTNRKTAASRIKTYVADITLTTAAQPNITSLGTLSSATVSGNINANGNIIGDNSTNISGINSVTATSFFGNGANLTGIGTQTNLGAFDNLVVAGIATFHSNINANGDLDVDGHTELDNLKVVGVATFTGGGANFENGINTFDVRYITNTNTKITFGTDIISLHGNVGINSTAPTSKLDVVGDTQLDDLNVAGVSTFTSNSIFLSKVGIGTTNPIAELDVNVGSSVTAFNVAGSEGQLFSVTNNLTSGSIFEVNDVSGMPSIDVDADGTIQLAPHGAGELVGIGTTVPTSKLHVVGDTLVTGVSTFSGNIDANGTLDVDGHTELDDVNVSGAITATTFTGNLTGNADTAGKADGLTTSRTIGGVSFDGSSNINLPGVNQAGNQDTSGNADTATALETARNIGGVSFDGTASINLPGVNQAGNQNTSGTAAGLSGSPNITITDVSGVGGNFTGVVTASSFSGSGANLTGIGTQTNLGAFDNLVVAGIATFHSNIDANANFEVAGTSKLAGDVTINRTTGLLGSKLSINKDADQEGIGIQLNQSSGITTSFTTFNSAGTQTFSLAHDTDVTPDLILKLKHSTDSAPAEKVRILSDGNVGIGSTITGGARLRVHKDGTNTLLQQWRGSLGSTAGERPLNLYSPATDSFSDYFRFQTGNAIKFQIDSIDALCIEDGGNIGIGTDDPQTKLHISGAGAGANEIRIDTSGTGLSFHNHSEFIGFMGNDSGKLFINAGGTQDTLSLRTNGSTALEIASNGNVGIASASPNAPLDVHKVNGTIAVFGDSRSDTFERIAIKNNVAGYPAITNDSTPDTLDLRSFGSVQATIDSNNNDTGNYFRVMANGEGGAGTEIFRAQEDGNFGIGNNNPTSKLDVTGDVKVSGVVTATDFDATSDIRLKTNVQPIDDPIAKVIQIEGVSFNWKKDDRPALGVIADQVEKILPQLVHGDDPKTVNYNGLVGLLIEVVKDQQKQIDTLSERISKLE